MAGTNGLKETALSVNVFTTDMGVKPSIGRLLLPSEGETTMADPVLVLDYAYWQTRFGGDPGIVGKRVTLNAMTSYGHTDLHLAPHWQVMGALEALNGWILFGLTSAFLFTVIQKAWPHTYAEQPPRS